MIDPTAQIHPSADIESGVTIGAGTLIWNRAQVRKGARIGRDAVIGRDVFIDEGVVIGDRVKIQNGALLYQGTVIANGVFVGPGAIITNDRHPRALNASGELAGRADWTIETVRVSQGASIGAGVIVVAGCDIGRHAMVGAGSVVTRDVGRFALVAGNPARPIGWVCVCGTRLEPEARSAGVEGGPRDALLSCPACHRRYRHHRAGPIPIPTERGEPA